MEFLHSAIWHDHDIDFARWLHPAIWHVALESWQWIHRVVAPCNVIRGSGMTCHWIRPNVRHIRILHTSGFDFDHITAVDMSFCTSHRNFIQIGPPWAEKNDVMSCHSRLRISAILDFSVPLWVRWKAHVRLPIGRQQIVLIAEFLRQSRFCILATDRQTNKQTDRRTDGQHRSTKPLSLSRAAN